MDKGNEEPFMPARNMLLVEHMNKDVCIQQQHYTPG